MYPGSVAGACFHPLCIWGRAVIALVLLRIITTRTNQKSDGLADGLSCRTAYSVYPANPKPLPRTGAGGFYVRRKQKSIQPFCATRIKFSYNAGRADVYNTKQHIPLTLQAKGRLPVQGKATFGKALIRTGIQPLGVKGSQGLSDKPHSLLSRKTISCRRGRIVAAKAVIHRPHAAGRGSDSGTSQNRHGRRWFAWRRGKVQNGHP